ncbi:MAG: thiol-activated cytolysin family protein [Anaerolineae bacterium]|nr:thiol-activated cytolysin family protein [Anaerolineae bacterium]
MKRVLIIAVPLLIVIVLVAAGILYFTRAARPAEIASIIAEAGAPKPKTAEPYDHTSTPQVSIEGNYKRITETHNAADNISSVTYLGLNDDVIWTGSLTRGDQIHSFVYTPITIDRAPVTLSLSLESASGTGPKITKTVSDPKLSTIRQGISDLLKGALTDKTTVAAKADFKYQQVVNEAQLSLFLGADVKYAGASVKSRFDWTSTSKKTKIMAKYQQIYYTVDMDMPQTPADLFAPSVSPDQVARAIPPGSMPVYVSSVSYGMMALVFMESDYSADVMNAAVKAGYSGLVDVQVQSGVTARKALETSTIQIVVYGGSTAGLNDLEENYQGFKKVINASTKFGPDSPGVPLMYRFRNAVDNTLALVTLTGDYTLVRQLKIRQPMRITVDKIVCEMANDEGPTDTLNMDRFYITVTGYQRKDSKSPEVMVTQQVDQHVLWAENPDTGGAWRMDKNDSWIQKPNSIDVVFDTEDYDTNLARLVFNGYARDWDSNVNKPEEGWNKLEILGKDFFKSRSDPYIMRLTSSDFIMRVEISITPID